VLFRSGVDDSMDLRKVGGQYVAQGGAGGVGDIMNALLLYGGPGIAAGKPGVASAGVFAGEKALGANLAMKKIAEKALAAGKDPDEVRRVTGWFTGMEGKPRFEIDDSSVNWVKFKKPYTADQTAKLGEVIEHKELFKQYPELSDVDVRVTIDPFLDESLYGGRFTGDSINVIKRTSDEAKDTVLHEVQHWIQKKEGFARGGNVDAEYELLQSKGGFLSDEIPVGVTLGEHAENIYRNLAGEIEARDVSARRTWDAEMREAVPPDLRKDAIIRWGDKESEEIFMELVR
jgi:hypothetical protein